MHNRVGDGVTSFEIGWGDALAIVPVLGVILVLAFYPQFGLWRSEKAVRADVIPAQTAQRLAALPAGWHAYAPYFTYTKP